MLNMLRKIVQDVRSAKDLKAALNTLVLRVREEMGVPVCSVYFWDNEANQFDLLATEGLNKRAIGKVKLQVDEGLVGLVATRQEPINLASASDHPQYRYLPETGEERYASFLGVPIIEAGKVLGVLVIQRKERKVFTDEEVSFLVTLSIQISSVIAQVETFDYLMGKDSQEIYFFGTASSPGIAMGRAVAIVPTADLDSVPDRKVKQIQAELDLFEEALDAVRKDIQKLSQKLSKQLRPEELALFDAYLLMLDDKQLIGGITKVIRDGQWARGAVREVIMQNVQRFEAMDDPYLKERATDIKDLGRRILAQLQKEDQKNLDFPENTILISEEISPSMLSDVPDGRLVGIVSVLGSNNSHVSILARAMGIPAITGVADLPYHKMDGLSIIVNGFLGEIVTNPTNMLYQRYYQMAEEERQLQASLETLQNLPCITPDGHRVSLMINTGIQGDMSKALALGAEGVGLFRTEIPFILNSRFPGEKEQQAIYREQLQAFHPLPVTMRTLDIGGDKALPYFPINESNPFLGWRGIRITLDHPEIFMLQIRAMLKANEGLENLKIMLPMISSMYEVEHSLRLIHRAWHEIREEGVLAPMPPVGIMIEVPSAVYLAKRLSEEIDFISVGSNDLTQYILAVDRNNTHVADLYNYYHPAVLYALAHSVEAAHSTGTVASICGEMAGDPIAAVLLLGMGFDSLSMNASSLPKVKSVLRTVTYSQAKQLLNDVLKQDDPSVVKSILQLELSSLGLGKIIGSKQRTD